MGETYYVNFLGGINDQTCQRIMAVCAEIVSGRKHDTIYFLFASGGGSVESGVALYNYLRALPINLVMHNTGAIDSIATVVFHAAETRFASPHSTFLFHGVTWGFGPGQTVTRPQLEEIRSNIIEAENKIAKILPTRCKLTEEEIRKLFAQGETKDSTFAVDKAIVQAVNEPRVPANAPIASLFFN